MVVKMHLFLQTLFTVYVFSHFFEVGRGLCLPIFVSYIL